MKLIGSIFAFLLMTAFIVLVIWGSFVGFDFLAGQFGKVGAAEMPVLIIASAVYLGGVLVIASFLRAAHHRHDKQVAPEKKAIYSKLMNVLTIPELNSISLSREMAELAPDVKMWGGDEVLKRFMKLNASIQKGEVQQNNLKFLIGNLMLEIRKDLGHRNRGVGVNMLTRKVFADNQETSSKEISSK
ncbi:hypothetical protein RCC89_05855 [Cytophagaceae bacterium ABcell3]|nr:hypothetical protein RCC89_05855 [Cytophagaceae bacterium ABcell3]